MQPIRKKNPRKLRHGRLMLLLAATVLLAGSAAAYVALNQPDDTQSVTAVVRQAGKLHAYEPEDVAALRVTLRSGEQWLLTQDENGALTVDGDSGYQVAEREKTALLDAAAVVAWEDVLTDDASDYADHFADFGLDTPRVIAEITYRDGTAATVRIGNDYALEESGWCYMTIDGDPRLFTLDTGTADSLAVTKAGLHPVEQPVLHKARFDRITFTGADGQIQAQWMLKGEIGGDAEDRWLLTVPFTYPADGVAMNNLRTNVENIRMGEYVGAATSENLAAYGFDAPRFILEVHMAEGSIGTTDASGVYAVTDWPETTFTLTVGGQKNDAVDYVLMDDAIYLTSRFSLQTFMDMNPTETLTRYTVPAALGNLAGLTVETADGVDTFTITRTEQVAENNELVTDSDGQVVYDVTCTRNGAEFAYASFEAAYNSLLVVTVSGTLPEDWTAEAKPHTTYTFTQVDGTVHTVALAPYDAFHDAVILDGNAVFYLIKGGMTLNLR